jgi:hypothetical protein
MNPYLVEHIHVCESRCFVLEPTLNRFKATAMAGARGSKTFGAVSLLRKTETNTKLIQRRLIPFWNVSCRSKFHYDRSSTYNLSAQDEDAVEITIQMNDGQRLVLPVNPQAKNRSLTLNGIERCVTERIVSELISGYELSDSKSLREKVGIFPKDKQEQMRAYLTNTRVPVLDLINFYQTQTVEGRSLYNDLEDENIQIILPSQPANRVVGDVMKKVMVSIEPVAIHEWELAVEVADLYYRPAYVFEFEKLDKERNVTESKLEQLDAISGEWMTISSREIVQPGGVPWDKIMHLTIDASVVVLQELGGPWVRISAGLVGVGSEYIPGIVQDVRKSKIDKTNFES